MDVSVGLINVGSRKRQRRNRSTRERIELKKFKTKNNATTIKYRGTEFYRYELETHQYLSMVKRGKTEKTFKLQHQPLGNRIAKENKQNVQQLLEKQFNNDEKKIKWEELPELAFFKNIIYGHSPDSENDEESPTIAMDEEEKCECLETECGKLHV